MESQENQSSQPDGRRPERRRRSRKSLIGSAALGAAALALAVPAVAAFAGGSENATSDPIAATDTQGELGSVLEARAVSTHLGGEAGAGLAEALGLDPGELGEALRSGQTLAEVAEANGVERQVVVDALVAGMSERIDRGVASGRISADRATELKAGAPERAEQVVDGEAPFPGGGCHHGPRGGLGGEAGAVGPHGPAPTIPDNAPATDGSDPQLL